MRHTADVRNRIEYRPLQASGPQRCTIRVNGVMHRLHTDDPVQIAAQLVANRDRRQRMQRRQARAQKPSIANR